MTGSPWYTVAERLLDPEAVTSAVPDRDAASLSHGLAGTALLHARLSTAGNTFEQAADRHWSAAAQHLTKHPVDFSGIQGGQGALAASLIVGTTYLSDPDRYRDLVARSTAWLSVQARALAATYQHNAIPHWHIYDSITGLSGIGRALLAAHDSGHSQAEPGLTAALTTLTAILAPTGGSRPGWYLPAQPHPSPGRPRTGVADTGLAHGVAGPLALLATAAKNGLTVPGQTDAINYAAAWLLHWRHADGRWPTHLTGEELDHDTSPPAAAGRLDAWCYGTPGIARALTLAGEALHEPRPITVADDALTAQAERNPRAWDVEGPTLCHGHAGVLLSAPPTSHLANTAAEAVRTHYLPGTPFCFPHHAHHQRHHNPGLLTGAAGVALALADFADVPKPATSAQWISLVNLR